MTLVQENIDTAPAPAAPAAYRTVDPLVVEVERDRFVLASPRAAKRVTVTRPILDLLLGAREGLPEDWAATPEAGAITRLIRFGFLVDHDTAVPAPWDAWGTAAWTFHNRIRDVPFILNEPSELTDRHTEELLTRPRPSSSRHAHLEPILLLPRVRTRCDASYLDVLEARRTYRAFERAPVRLDAFSDLLHYTFGPLRFVDAGPMGVLQLRAAASGGARHETEAFVFVFDVEHVEPGLYAYDGIRHGLVPLRTAAEAGRETLEDLTFHQKFFETAAFGVLTAAVAERMSWKYRNPRAYKFLLQNIGHLTQVFSMTACALGLGAAITGAIKDTEADRLLGLEPPGEFTTFALACGVPRVGPDGLPLGIATPSRAPEAY